MCPLRPVHALLRPDLRRPVHRAVRPGRRRAGRHRRGGGLSLSVLREHHPNLSGRRPDGDPVPIRGPPLRPDERRHRLPALRLRLQHQARHPPRRGRPASRARQLRRQRRVALRQGALRLPVPRRAQPDLHAASARARARAGVVRRGLRRDRRVGERRARRLHRGRPAHRRGRLRPVEAGPHGVSNQRRRLATDGGQRRRRRSVCRDAGTLARDLSRRGGGAGDPPRGARRRAGAPHPAPPDPQGGPRGCAGVRDPSSPHAPRGRRGAHPVRARRGVGAASPDRRGAGRRSRGRPGRGGDAVVGRGGDRDRRAAAGRRPARGGGGRRPRDEDEGRVRVRAPARERPRGPAGGAGARAPAGRPQDRRRRRTRRGGGGLGRPDPLGAGPCDGRHPPRGRRPRDRGAVPRRRRPAPRSPRRGAGAPGARERAAHGRAGPRARGARAIHRPVPFDRRLHGEGRPLHRLGGPRAAPPARAPSPRHRAGGLGDLRRAGAGDGRRPRLRDAGCPAGGVRRAPCTARRRGLRLRLGGHARRGVVVGRGSARAVQLPAARRRGPPVRARGGAEGCARGAGVRGGPSPGRRPDRPGRGSAGRDRDGGRRGRPPRPRHRAGGRRLGLRAVQPAGPLREHAAVRGVHGARDAGAGGRLLAGRRGFVAAGIRGGES